MKTLFLLFAAIVAASHAVTFENLVLQEWKTFKVSWIVLPILKILIDMESQYLLVFLKF